MVFNTHSHSNTHMHPPPPHPLSYVARVVEQLISNSKTFEGKTRFAQRKYINKKQQRYCPFLTVQPPTPAFIADMYYMQKSSAIYGMRVDTLSQMMSYANVYADARVLCNDTINGLLTATVLRRVGTAGVGRVFHVYHGHKGVPNLGAVASMDLEAVAEQKLLNVSFDVLAQVCATKGPDSGVAGAEAASTRQSAVVVTPERASEAPVEAAASLGANAARAPLEVQGTGARRQFFRACDQEEAQEALAEGVDSLLIASRLHPLEAVERLWQQLNPSGSFCVYCPYLVPLQDVYEQLRDGGHAVQLVMEDCWLREYQVLPNRTHPLVAMSCTGGYMLSGIKVLSDAPWLGLRQAGPGRQVEGNAQAEAEGPPLKKAKLEGA